MTHQLAYLTVNPNIQATGDLSIIAFYYVLRSGEYKKTWKVKLNRKLLIVIRTQQFRVQDVGF